MTGAWDARLSDNFDALFARMVALSVALHVALFVAGALLLGKSPKPLGFNYIEASIVAGTPGPIPEGRPDAVPAKIEKEEKKEPEKKEAIKKEPEKKEAMTLPDRKTTKKKPKKKEEPEEHRTIDSAIDRIKKKRQERLGLPGGDPSVSAVYPGGGGMADRIASLYLHKVSSTIRRNWSLPSGIARDSDIHVKILVRIGRNGELLERKIHQSSGNPLVDRSAVNAIVKSTPLPPPPPLVASEIEREGIIFDFFPQE